MSVSHESDITYLEKQVELPNGYWDESSQQLLKTVTIREMSGTEEDILLNEKNAKVGNTLNKILDNVCTLTDKPGVKFIDNLLIVDQLYLLVQTRIVTYGNIYKFDIKHTEEMDGCGATTGVKLELDSLKFSGSPKPESLEETVELPKSGISVTFKKNQGKDQLVLSKILQGNSPDKITQLLQFRAKKIISSDGKELQLDVIKKLTLTDRKFLRKKMNEVEGNAETTLDINCSSCGEVMKVEMPLDQDFFCLRDQES